MDYILNLKKTANDPVIRLAVRSEVDLTEGDINSLKGCSDEIFRLYKDKPLSTAVLSELKAYPVNAAGESCSLTVRKIQELKPGSRIRRTRAQIFRKLVAKKPKFTFKFLWSFFVAPFITLHRFHNQQRKFAQKMHKIVGSKPKTQKQLVSCLKRTRNQLSSGRIDIEKENPILKAFDAAVKYGQGVNQLLSIESDGFEDLKNEIVAAINAGRKAAAPVGTRQGPLAMIPLTLQIDDEPFPVIISFEKTDKGLIVEIKGIPEDKQAILHPRFMISNDDAEKSIPKVVEVILQMVSINNAEESKITVTNREKIRIRNLELMGLNPLPKPGASAAGQGDKNKKLRWLHESICNYANPLELPKNATAKHKNFLSELIHELGEAWPEASIIDKVEWLICSVEEECAAFFDVEKSLTKEEKMFFLERIEDHMNDLRRHLKGVDGSDEIFSACFERFKKIKEAKAKLKDNILSVQKERISEKIETDRKCNSTVKICKNALSEGLNSKAKPVVQKNVGYKQLDSLLESIKTSVADLNPENTLKNLQELHKNLDALIEKKEYQAAFEYALKALSLLPVPSGVDKDNFWSIPKTAYAADSFSSSLADLVKDVWESSLRMNYTYPQPNTVIQLMKAQTINAKLLNSPDNTLDYTEIESIVHRHPHIRFGWKPEQQAELKKIMEFIESEKAANKKPCRRDGQIRNYSLWHTVRRKQKGLNDDGMLIDFVRMQTMLTTLMKPDYCLTPFFGAGSLSQVAGISWLDSLAAKAVAAGAKTRDEIRRGIKSIRLKEVQDRLKSMSRLELGTGKFVTEFDCVTIIDPKALISSNELAYIPNGYGLPYQFEANYGVIVDQVNTKPLVENARGEEKFLGVVQGKERYIGLRDALSPQLSYTEAKLMEKNLQEPPKGQVNQIENYMLDAMQVDKLNFNEAKREFIRPAEIDPGSISEALSTLFSERNLGDPEVQRSIILVLTRSFLLEKKLKEMPRDLLAAGHRLKELVAKKSKDANVFPFILQIGQIIKEHAEALKDQDIDHIDELITEIPCFDNHIKIGDKTMTGKEMLEQVLQDPDREHSTAAVTYLYSMMDRSLADIDEKTITMILHCATFLGPIADSVALPQYNKMAENWIYKTFLPDCMEKFRGNHAVLSKVFDKWMELLFPTETVKDNGKWTITCNTPLVIQNDKIKIHVPTLQMTSRDTGKRIGIRKVTVPEHVQRNEIFVRLFGRESIKAEMERNDNPNHFIYTFNYGSMNNQYRVIYDQSNGSIQVYSTLPLDPSKKDGKKGTFLYVSEIANGGTSTVEKCIEKNGLWVNQKDPNNAFLYSQPVSTARRSEMYRVKLTGEGKISCVRSVKGDWKVAIMTPEETTRLVPVVDANEVLTLVCYWGRVREIRCLDTKTSFVKSKGDKWIYNDHRLGENHEWDIDLSKRAKRNRDDTQEKRFIDAFGTDHRHFLLPLRRGEETQFLIFPNEIEKTPHGGVIFKTKAIEGSQHLPPITLSFGKEGEMKGSPSAFLYLAYYFLMKKDYDRASFYLNKASVMPALSDKEKGIFNKVADLFEKVPYRSFESIVVQLKAGLTIRKILKTQFSTPVYNKENEGEYFAGVSRMTSLYKEYLNKLPRHEHVEMKLKNDELFGLDRIRWASFERWIEKQRAGDEAKKNGDPKILPIKDNLFINTKIGGDLESGMSDDMFAAVILLAEDIHKNFTVDELTKGGIPDAGALTRHLIHYVNYIGSGKPVDKLLRYLTAIPKWELYPPKTEDEKMIVSLAREVRTLLICMCVEKKRTWIDPDRISKVKSGLPYWGRDNNKLARFILTQYDIYFGGRKLYNLTYQVRGYARQMSNAVYSMKGKTIGEALNLAPQRVDKDENEDGKGGVSLKAILDEFQDLPGDHCYLPIEVTELSALIGKENVDVDKVREILTIMREAESRNFPELQIRAMSENMREIAKLEQGIVEKNQQEAARPDHVSYAIEGISRLQKTLTEGASSFSGFAAIDLKKQMLDLNNLQEKFDKANAYFDPSKVDSEAMKEEYTQILSGLKAAKNTLEGELKRKNSFSRKEINAFTEYLDYHLVNKKKNGDSLVHVYREKKNELLNLINESDPVLLPKKIKKMLAQRDLYTDFELIDTMMKLYKDSRHLSWFRENGVQFDHLVTEYLLYKTAMQQFQSAQALLKGKPSQESLAKALDIVKTGMELNRYFDENGKMIDPIISRKCLVAEARAGIIYRPGQRQIIDSVAKDPKQWMSLRMGLGKTSYALPTIAEILADQGKSVVITVPEKLLKSNRKDIDRATRMFFDQAGIEFSLPLTKDLPVNYLSEKVIQIEETIKNKGYIITTVEELSTLHDTCILLEDEKSKIHKDGVDLSEDDAKKLIQIEMRLHYYRKIDRLLNGDATELNIPSIFFGDETDDTHHITHEVSIAIGEKRDPSKPVREVSRAILETILSAREGTELHPLRQALINNTYPVMSEDEVLNYMKSVAKNFMHDPAFLSLTGEPGAAVIKGLDPKQWADYLVGTREQLPDGLPAWSADNIPLKQAQVMIGAAKQLLTATFPNFLSQKSGNDLGLSDFEGFIVVPKLTKNETEGMRFGDEFEMIFAQYLGYLEFKPCQSLTVKSTEFFESALKTFKEKSPNSYTQLIKDYRDYVESLPKKSKEVPALFEYLMMPQAYTHRWNILDDVIFDGGYIKRFTEQVRTNVQESFHRKPCGGVTGTLDPYVLPYISDEVQLHQGDSSTREVEAETFLRMGLNVAGGLDRPATCYADPEAMSSVDAILADKSTTAFINSNGDTSEGMNTFTWIEKIRKTANGKKRSYLFMHPQERIPYFWSDKAAKAVPYKGQELPENIVCMYAPSDVRGVDLPIRRGKVHMFVSPTASPQELVQSLYRARQLGGDHQLVMHLPESLKSKIAECTGRAESVTYGDVIVYLINRTTRSKLELNLKAQLMKVQFDFKTAVTRYLKEINPDFDRNDFWTKDNFINIAVSTKAQAEVFKVLRSIYIELKEIDFAECYAPREFISGTDKVIEEYSAVKRRIEALLTPLKEASFASFRIQCGLIGLNELKSRFTDSIQGITALAPAGKGINDDIRLVMNQIALGAVGHVLNPDHRPLFDHLTNSYSDVEELMARIHALPQDQRDESTDRLIASLDALNVMIAEVTYGKGKSHLYHTLNRIKDSMEGKKNGFESRSDAHKKYLPELTARSSIGNAGTNEQVKEMQQQKTKTQEIEKVEVDPERVDVPAENFFYLLDPLELLSSYHAGPNSNLEVLDDISPFSEIYMTKSSRSLLNVLAMVTGDPLLYIAVDNTGGNTKISLISKLDYHTRVHPKLAELPDLTVYEALPTGFRWVSGGQNSDFRRDIPDELMNKLMTIKAYLGYKEEFATNSQVIANWKASLTPDRLNAVRDYVAKRGTPAQRKVFLKI